MRLFTIGFTRKSARQFFGLLQESGASSLVDIRLNNVSQLSGFAKKADLEFFCARLCSMEYRHEPLLAPTADILDAYRKKRIGWSEYEQAFLELLHNRHVEKVIEPALLDNAVLLCSEESPRHCHRRLVSQYLAAHWAEVEVIHL